MFPTFLSDEIYNFMTLFTKNINNKYICDTLTINSSQIDLLFIDCCNANFSIHDQSEEWYRIKMKLIHEIMYEASEKINSASEIVVNKLWGRSSWTDRIEDLKKCFQYYKSNKQSDLLKCVLILTSIIERCLGNVYRVQNKNVPFLLKDLLETKYLFDLLEPSIIRLMQLIFGTSKSLNLRNITWHGFISNKELTQKHIAILFILIAKIGDTLNKKQIVVSNISYRPQITNINQRLSEIDSRNKFINLFEYLNYLNDIIRDSENFVGSSHTHFWVEITTHPSKNCNNNCIIVLLPIFEHLLRRIFCKINNCDERNIFAMTKEKYLTLDEVFAENFQEKPNKLLNILNQGAIDLFHDLFSHLLGPRIRDKLSHGEIVLNSISCRFTEILLNLILFIVVKTNDYLNITETTLNNTLANELYQNFENYESLYHPNTILKYKILHDFETVEKLLKIPKPTENEITKCEIQKNDYFFSKMIAELSTNSKNLEQYKVPTIFRPKSELKVVKKLTQITEKIDEISCQILLDNEDRYRSFLDKILGSRQINRYDEILQSIFIVYESLNCILHIVVLLMKRQFLATNTDFEFKKEVFKFLKSTLSYADKILRFSSVKLNKWEKVRTLTNDYKRLLNIEKML